MQHHARKVPVDTVQGAAYALSSVHRNRMPRRSACSWQRAAWGNVARPVPGDQLAHGPLVCPEQAMGLLTSKEARYAY